MQLSAQEEYGLRCLLRLARAGPGEILSIPEISRAEGISMPYAAKLMRVLREGGLAASERGPAGGYHLTRSPEAITAKQAIQVLGGDFYGGEFCTRFSGHEDQCTHSIDCSIRSLWRAIQKVVDQLLSRTSLRDLMCGEQEMDRFVGDLVVLTGAIGSATAGANHG
jgi:Rrf2 family protein